MTIKTFLPKKIRGIALLTVSVLSVAMIPVAQSQLVFRNTVTGDVLDLSFGKKGEKSSSISVLKISPEGRYSAKYNG